VVIANFRFYIIIFSSLFLSYPHLISSYFSITTTFQLLQQPPVIKIYQGTKPLKLDDEALRKLHDAYLTYIRELC
jgi:hypothetical protein